MLLLVFFGVTAPAEESAPPLPELVTNLFQLRRVAELETRVVHPFRIVADVMDVDVARRLLALRDASGMEFIQVDADFSNQNLESGATVYLEGKGSILKHKNFGLVMVPGMVVENDGLHASLVQSGTVVLPAGTNPIALQWFNRYWQLGLNVEYEGPDLPRQRIPSSAFSRAVVAGTAGRTNFAAGLDYRCYEGEWEALPDFGKYQPARIGIATNLDAQVRTRDDCVGLEFNGFITIPRAGAYTFHLTSDDGSRLFVGNGSVDLRVSDKPPAPGAAEHEPTSDFERNDHRWVTLEGTVTRAGIWGAGTELQLRVGNDHIRVEAFEGGDLLPSVLTNNEVRVSGLYQNVLTEAGIHVPGRLRVLNWKAVQPVRLSPDPRTIRPETTTSLPADNAVVAGPEAVLLRAAEIKALSSELAKRQLPVSIRGVVTAFRSRYTGAVIQDSTRGVFVDLLDLPGGEFLRRGEFYQIDGVTGPGLFAPVVVARRITHLGPGQLPTPLRATREQLVNGSLDTEYVEIDGIVTAIHAQRVELLTQGGKVALNLSDFRPEGLPGRAGDLVRIRGCFFAGFNQQTRKLEVGSMRVEGATIEILQRVQDNPFEAPRKSIGELLLYDPQAAPFRRLNVSGQIIYTQPGDCFLTDGTNGMHVTIRNAGSNSFAAGDLVDAVGFLELGGPAAELKEATMRKTGRALLPVPTKLAPDQLLLARHSATLVQVEATLMNQWREGADYVLELQSGFLAFKARINSGGLTINLPSLGSRLELTGAYAPLGIPTGDGTLNGFELLLPAPTGIRILATPPWWNLKRLLALAGILALLLCVVLVWNKELRRQVQERTRKWETEIRHRQRAELQQAAEAERSRIARDLHDELGTGLTEVSLLASAGLGQFLDGEKIRERFHGIAEKARALVSGLDVIVWAIDPKRNSLQSFADYLADYANELFSHSAIACRLRLRIEGGTITLSEAARHSLFLAVKEALHNVIRHAAAEEVELRILQVNDQMHIVITDNGRGCDLKTIRRGNGLTNLQERLQAMHGECHIESQPGGGTTVKFIVPLVPVDQNGVPTQTESHRTKD